MEKITVRVPASTSNLGPGFDCLGAALRLYNFVTVARVALTPALSLRERGTTPSLGEGNLVPAIDRSEIVGAAAQMFFKRVRRPPFSFSCSIRGDVPACRGLGGSVTVRLGVLCGLNELCRRPLDRLSIFHLCAQLEGHPDNAAPAALGGFTVASGGAVQRFKVSPRLGFVLLVPGFEIATAKARKVLPAKISRLAGVENSAHACAITAAFASRRYENLRGAFADRLHQPFREKLIPFLPRVVAAAEKAGALGAFLSGSGSTICAITLQNRHRIAAAMQRAARSTSARTMITTADNSGAQICHG
jgi:homoserine kinase